MVTFGRHTDEETGLDLYDIYDHTAILAVDLDPWTVKKMIDLLDHMNIPYRREERE